MKPLQEELHRNTIHAIIHSRKDVETFCPSELEEILNADGGGYWVDKGRSGRLGEGHFYTADEGLVCCLVL